MKKAVLIIIILLIAAAGYYSWGVSNKRQLVKQAQNKAEEFIYRNYEDINAVSVDKDYYKFDPMGGLAVGGHVNGDKTLSFHIIFNIENGKVGRVSSLVNPKNFPPEKEACKHNFCE